MIISNLWKTACAVEGLPILTDETETVSRAASLLTAEMLEIWSALEGHRQNGDWQSGMTLRNAIVNSTLGATFPQDNDLGLEGYALQLIGLCKMEGDE